MYLRRVCAAVAAIVLVESCRALAQAPTQTEQVILQELREIRRELIRIKAELAQLRESEGLGSRASQPDEDATWPEIEGFMSRGPDLKKLRSIKLPENPTDDQVKDYVRDIMDASRGQNSFSDRDPQVAMLIKVGADSLGLLMDALDIDGYGGFAINYHVESAVLKLAGEEHKDLIKESLEWRPFLAKVVIERGWERDVRDILVAQLSQTGEQLPIEWIQAVANLGDPETYDDLKRYLVLRDGRYATFQVIRDLPDLDLTESIADIWEKTGYHEWEERGVAKMAVQYGHVEALGYLVNFVAYEQQNQWEASEIRRLILSHLDFFGSNRELVEWFRKNSERLLFDEEKRKYILPADEEGASGS